MTSPLNGQSAIFTVNDVFDELSEENKRLTEDLKIANKFFDKVKLLVNKLCEKYEKIIDTEDREELDKLIQEIVEMNERSTNSVNKPIKCCQSSSLSLKTKRTIKNKTRRSRSLNKAIPAESTKNRINQRPLRNIKTNIETKPKKKTNRLPFENIVLTHSQREMCFDPNTDSYKCPQSNCQKCFSTNLSLYIHLRSVHIERWLSCSLPGCDSRFKTNRNLKQHLIQKHSNSKPFVCHYENCSKAFKLSTQLKYHVKSHSDYKEFRCHHDNCQYETHLKSLLQSHLKSHSESRQFQCTADGCGKVFKTSCTLKLHQSVHREETFRCTHEGCERQFRRKSTLSNHIKQVHLKSMKIRSKLYSCEWPGCDYRCVHKFTLDKHKMLHTGEKPFVCEWSDCGKRFRLQQTLKEHLNIHNKLRPHCCSWPGCQYRSACSANLVKHIKQVHKINRLSEMRQ